MCLFVPLVRTFQPLEDVSFTRPRIESNTNTVSGLRADVLFETLFCNAGLVEMTLSAVTAAGHTRSIKLHYGLQPTECHDA
jgi:hypothetical protein